MFGAASASHWGWLIELWQRKLHILMSPEGVQMCKAPSQPAGVRRFSGLSGLPECRWYCYKCSDIQGVQQLSAFILSSPGSIFSKQVE